MNVKALRFLLSSYNENDTVNVFAEGGLYPILVVDKSCIDENCVELGCGWEKIED